MVKLFLVRHGESVWNLENRFTGWIDVSLSKNGVKEAVNAGKILKDEHFDIIFTSQLIRAQETLFKILESNLHSVGCIRIHEKEKEWYKKYSKSQEDSKKTLIYADKSLNERFYGDLQGLNKEETVKIYGEQQVHIWRRSYDIAPPNGESLKMTSKRTLPYYKKHIEKALKDGKNVLVVAHGNSLRAIIKHIENLSKEEIVNLNLKTGVPITYTFDDNLNIINKK